MVAEARTALTDKAKMVSVPDNLKWLASPITSMKNLKADNRGRRSENPQPRAADATQGSQHFGKGLTLAITILAPGALLVALVTHAVTGTFRPKMFVQRCLTA